MTTMRDAFIKKVLEAMDRNENIFFLSADFGAPALDEVRARHPDRFINVGIAEQNLINVASGIGLEGITVFAYAIAPFITMRCYEQIRVNMAILSQLRGMNVNLIGVGAGFSYEVSGPTHHCLEDLSIMRTLPNFKVFSPCDHFTASALFDYCMSHPGPKYLRFDAKALPALHAGIHQDDVQKGFVEVTQGGHTCLVATGYMVHRALEVHKKAAENHLPLGVVDVLAPKGFDGEALSRILRRYSHIMTLEEGFVGKGGLDAAIASLLFERNLTKNFTPIGLSDRYHFHLGTRDYLHGQEGLSTEAILRQVAS
ncbi:MAG: transketolase family protein [Bdellovibrionales bacterium]